MRRFLILLLSSFILLCSGCAIVPRVQDVVDQLPNGEVGTFRTTDLGGYVTFNAEVIGARKSDREVAFERLELEASAPWIGGRTVLIENYRRDVQADEEDGQ